MYQKYENMIKALTRDYFPVKEDAEDAAQEIAIKLLTMKDSPPQDNEAGWMYVVIDNACKDIYRAAKRRQGELPPMESDVLANEPYQYAVQSEELVEFTTRYEELPAHLREVCWLRYQKGLSYEAIAEKLGIQLGTVASRLSRAKEALSKEA